MKRKPVVNIGEQRFDKLREQGSFYIDKTDFIREWWESGSTVTFVTRPRRFGKTLNMSMLECFFSKKYEDRADLFEGLSIFGDDTDKEKYRNLQGKFPVIFLTFANIKAAKYTEMENKITELIVGLYNENDYLLDSDFLNEKEYYKNIKIGMPSDTAVGAVHQMACFMQHYYQANVIIILDEYDTPMEDAWLSEYWNEAVRFFSSFFNATFKTNPYLERGMITGITRIAKESNVSANAETSEKRYKRFSQASPFGDAMFTGMNNLDVITITSDEYATAF